MIWLWAKRMKHDFYLFAVLLNFALITIDSHGGMFALKCCEN